jgi:hypothetical protein
MQQVKERNQMEITLERSELAILVLHMNIMRKPIKKGFKANYGHFESRKQLKIYDGLKERFETELNEEIDPILFVLTEPELNMLHSFINWYVQEIQKSAGVQQADITKDEQIEILVSIQNKVNMLIDEIIDMAVC